MYMERVLSGSQCHEGNTLWWPLALTPFVLVVRNIFSRQEQKQQDRIRYDRRALFEQLRTQQCLKSLMWWWWNEWWFAIYRNPYTYLSLLRRPRQISYWTGVFHNNLAGAGQDLAFTNDPSAARGISSGYAYDSCEAIARLRTFPAVVAISVHGG